MVNLIRVLNPEHVDKELTMTPTEQNRFDALYHRHFRALKLRGLSDKTIDVYARAVRRLTQHYQCCPDQLSVEQLEAYFAQLVQSHSWSTVKVDRNGLHGKFVLKAEVPGLWSWLSCASSRRRGECGSRARASSRRWMVRVFGRT